MIRLDQIAWEAKGFRLEAISFHVPTARYAVLMGATGTGKTSLLEIICGLRAPTTGRVWLDERDVTGLQPGERRIGYVPQDGALFPSMSVRQQIGFALTLRDRPAPEVAKRVHALAAQLGVLHLLDRRPDGLSGGERQRVAIGRALAAEPSLLLLDEPLSAVDETLRDELGALLKKIQRENGLTVLHVTHSSREASQLADVFFRLESGKLAPAEIPSPSSVTSS